VITNYALTPTLSLQELYTFWIFYHQEYFKISVLEDLMKFLVAEKTSKGLAAWPHKKGFPIAKHHPQGRGQEKKLNNIVEFFALLFLRSLECVESF
jgi:hypothetical protein